MLNERIKASLIHLAISVFIISIVLSVFLLVWYPAPYAEISGLNSILKILVGIDVVLGPLITLIIFNKNKPSLKFDLAVVASLQIAALCYGVFTVYQGHPAYIVYAVDRFELVSAQDAHPEQSKYDEFKISKLGFPKLAYAKMPTDTKQRNDIIFSALQGVDLEKMSQFYEPFLDHKVDIVQNGIDPNKLFASKSNNHLLQLFLEKHNENRKSLSFHPIVGKEKDAVIVISKKTGEIIGTISIDPWT